MAVTSTITMTEILVKPYRMLDEEAFSRFYRLLATYPNLEWIPPDLEAAEIAARFRAEYRLKMADALQAATAAQAGATGLVTNDTDFERVPAFETLVLDRLL
jgi:predicted nucleic acid-binding protein